MSSWKRFLLVCLLCFGQLLVNIDFVLAQDSVAQTTAIGPIPDSMAITKKPEAQKDSSVAKQTNPDTNKMVVTTSVFNLNDSNVVINGLIRDIQIAGGFWGEPLIRDPLELFIHQPTCVFYPVYQKKETSPRQEWDCVHHSQRAISSWMQKPVTLQISPKKKAQHKNGLLPMELLYITLYPSGRRKKNKQTEIAKEEN